MGCVVVDTGIADSTPPLVELLPLAPVLGPSNTEGNLVTKLLSALVVGP